MPVLTLLTDFGLDDYYVGAVKGTILRLAPAVTLIPIDISHDVEPGDIHRGAYLLAAAAPAFPAGTVHLAVVDPGVGSPRRILVVSLGEALYVAPDNGILTGVLSGGLAGALEKAGGSEPRIHAVERAGVFLQAPGQTFHGRDRFAPVAAYLLRGEPLEELGPRIADPVLLPAPPPRREGRNLHGRVIHIDRFGNVITDIPSSWLPEVPFTASLGSHSTHRRADFYGQIPRGEAAVLPGSLGTLELSVNGESLAERWLIERDREVLVELAPESEEASRPQ